MNSEREMLLKKAQTAMDACWPELAAHVTRFLGGGGQGYVVAIETNGHPEAVKLLDMSFYESPSQRRDAARRARDELNYHRQMSQRTSGVAKCYDTAEYIPQSEKGAAPECRKSLFLIRMELLNPVTIPGPLTMRRKAREMFALHLAADVLRTVAIFEKAELIHKDIKISNVLARSQDGRIRYVVSDLGLTRPSSEKQRYISQCGTADYRAPEIIAGTKLIGARSDVYSTGVMLFKIMAADEEELYDPLLFSKDRSNYEFSEDIKDLILLCTAQDPRRRLSPTEALTETQKRLFLRDKNAEREAVYALQQQLCCGPADAQLLDALPETPAAALLLAADALAENDERKAIAQLSRPAADGSPAAQYYLARLLWHKDQKRANALLSAAAQNGFEPAVQVLAGRVPHSAPEALKTVLGL